MTFPSRRIIILLTISLTALFGYQIYWLSGLYRSTVKSKESQIEIAFQQADYAEIIDRLHSVSLSGRHGTMEIGTGFSEEHALTQVSVRTDSVNIGEDGSKSVSVTTVQVDNNDKSISSQEMAGFYQRGMHAGVDALTEVNFPKLDSLLVMTLGEAGLNVPHRLQMFKDNAIVASISTPGYIPSVRARNFDLAYGVSPDDKYRLTLEPLTGMVLREMTGMITASLILFFILAFSFWLLIHTMLSQKSLEEMKSDFTNNITHELKTPVSIIYAANEAILNFDAGNDPDKRREYLEISQVQLKKLEGMIEQILSMSMESRKTFELRKEDIALVPLLHSIAEQHLLSADKPCDFHIDAEDGLIIYADRFHLGNIIGNLIDNAIKYSGDSVIVGISARHTAGGIEISVKDNGIGISPDEQKHIFDKFYRVPTGNIHNVKGYGLGLYYVRTMLERHGGTISVSSSLGKGSKFSIILPQS